MNHDRFNELFYQDDIAQQPFELWMLVGIIEKMTPWLKTVIEIGVYKGGTLRFWREIVGASGLVIAVDDNARGFMDGLKKQYKGDKVVMLIVGDSKDKKIIDAVHSPLEHRTAGMLFIDGRHVYEHIRSDYHRHMGYVRPGGLIVFHGIRNVEVRRVWDEIVEKHNYAGVYELYDTHNSVGTGVIVTN